MGEAHLHLLDLRVLNVDDGVGEHLPESLGRITIRQTRQDPGQTRQRSRAGESSEAEDM